MDKPTTKPTKSERTRAKILEAARDLFAERGYEGATIRDVAARAAIDPAMVIRYFGSKDELFARAAFIDLKLPALHSVQPAAIGGTLIRHFLEVWEGAGSGAGMAILLRSATSNEYAANKMREVFVMQVQPALAAAGGDQRQARLRAGLISSQLLGLALGRYVLKLPPVVAMTKDEIIDWIGPTLQRYAVAQLP
jgi:AcrR family transcriptional regulator